MWIATAAIINYKLVTIIGIRLKDYTSSIRINVLQIKKAVPPLSLHGQLLWREFFYCAATKNPNFDRMQGNPICVQIPWDKNVEALAKWANVSESVYRQIVRYLLSFHKKYRKRRLSDRAKRDFPGSMRS